ncbi:MAG: FAD-dependent oxidoreductase, partial [Janthinobacterium lividum]
MSLRRRDALVAAGAACIAKPVASGTAATLPGRLLGANAALGHRLRSGILPEPTQTERAGVVVVGGGVAGLSAAWWLRRAGIANVRVVELEESVGGNAASGRNDVSAYAWGAHYVPLLTAESVYAAALFTDLGIITGRDPAGLPIYDPFALCADPRERLFRNGAWQEDLLPDEGVSEADRTQYAAFFTAMDAFRAARGSDGRKAFAIPLDQSSADDRYRALDRISMA